MVCHCMRRMRRGRGSSPRFGGLLRRIARPSGRLVLYGAGGADCQHCLEPERHSMLLLAVTYCDRHFVRFSGFRSFAQRNAKRKLRGRGSLSRLVRSCSQPWSSLEAHQRCSSPRQLQSQTRPAIGYRSLIAWSINFQIFHNIDCPHLAPLSRHKSSILF